MGAIRLIVDIARSDGTAPMWRSCAVLIPSFCIDIP